MPITANILATTDSVCRQAAEQLEGLKPGEKFVFKPPAAKYIRRRLYHLNQRAGRRVYRSQVMDGDIWVWINGDA